MPSLEKLPNHWDPKKRECKVIVDTPQGNRIKFRYEPPFQLFSFSHLLAAGLTFPYDFGFIPSTLGDDGDPIDVLILMEVPSHIGCLVDVRLIGVIEADQTQEGKTFTNDRLIGVATRSYIHQNVASIDEINPVVLDQVQEFFITYNKERGRTFKVRGRHGPERAARAVEGGIKAFQKKT
jgi:inorganic pyrophosphatase